MPGVVHTFALLLAIFGGWLDWRTRRIPNWLTVPGLLIGIALNSWFSGWQGARVSLEGALLGLGVLFPVVLLRGLGGGDWKLVGALGALVGPGTLFVILFFAIMIGGVMALYAMIRQKRVLTTLRNLWALATGFFIFGFRPHPEITLDDPGLIKLPFGVATAVATVFVLFVGGHIFL